MKKSAPKFILLLVIVAAIALFIHYDLKQYLTLDYLKSQREAFQQYYTTHTVQTVGVYMAVYIAATALSLPGAAILTLAGGAFFGVAVGTVVVSFASTIGATLAFLAARFLLRDFVQSRFSRNLKSINEGVERDGAFYLFTMRLIPIFPFFVVNLVMGLTPLNPAKFFLVSQIGMLPGTLVYVNAGTQIGQLDSLRGILSPSLLLSFALLGVFPLLAKFIVNQVKANRFLGKFAKPKKKTDYNLIVIGAGSGGLVSAYIAAQVKAKVALIEKHKMGGDCLNTGCVPSKALIKSAKVIHTLKNASHYGLKKVDVDYDFADVMERVQHVIRKVEPHDSVERYTSLGVDCIEGTARIVTPYEVEVNGRRLTTRNIIIATGGRPAPPPVEGADEVEYLTSDTVWNLRKLPRRLVVMGAGPIGCELAQCFQRLGSQVTLVQRGPRILPREDREAAEIVTESFRRDGVILRTGHTAKRFEVKGDVKTLVCEHGGKEVRFDFDEVLVALGRQANTTGFGLEDLRIPTTRTGTVSVDPFLRTNYPNILAVGDVAGPYQFTHTASHQAYYATVNALFRPFYSVRADYRVIPWCTFTDPEVARVGLSEDEARSQGIPHQVHTYGIDDLDRAIADGTNEGIVKVLTVPGKDRILGAMITGDHAGDYIVEFVAAMQHGFGMNRILGTVHIYPTLGEANNYAAGVWKRANAPEGLLRWVERFHTWRRGGEIRSSSPRELPAS